MEDRVVEAARAWLGTPYHHQASVLGVGCDCLGLVLGIWRELYGTEPEATPPYSRDWGETGGRELLRDAARRWMIETDLNDARVGDLVLFRMRDGGPAKHCAVLTGGNRMIHAYERAGVIEDRLSTWASRAAYAFRFPKEH